MLQQYSRDTAPRVFITPVTLHCSTIERAFILLANVHNIIRLVLTTIMWSSSVRNWPVQIMQMLMPRDNQARVLQYKQSCVSIVS